MAKSSNINMTIEENTIPHNKTKSHLSCLCGKHDKDSKCPVYLGNPNNWELNERFFDWHCVEAICVHGIGHHRGRHGCDGCCEYCPQGLWNKTTEDK